MATVNISIQATLNNPSNNFVIAWYTSDPVPILINSVAPAKPYGNPFQVPIPSLNIGTTYIIKLWESTNTTPTGTQRNGMAVTPQGSITTVRFPDYLIVDITPSLVSNTSAYVNATYAGWDYDIEEPGGIGTWFPDTSVDPAPRYHADVSGGFHLLQTGDLFQNGQKLVVRFHDQVVPAPATSSGIFTASVLVNDGNTGRILDSSYLNKAILLQGTGSILPIQLMPLSTVPDFAFVYLYSAGGTHVSSSITVGGVGDKIQRRSQVTKVVLAQNEILKLFKANGIWNVDYISPTVDMVGEIYYKMYHLDFNGLLLDGSEVSRTIYARLYDYFNNVVQNPASESSWASLASQDGQSYGLNQGFWTQGATSGMFRLPKVVGQFIRGANAPGGGSYGVMSGDMDRMRKHQHPVPIGELPGKPFGEGAVIVAGNYNGQSSTHTDMSGPANTQVAAGASAAVLQRVDDKTYPEHTRMYAIIRL